MLPGLSSPLIIGIYEPFLLDLDVLSRVVKLLKIPMMSGAISR
jgi:hypothetical protein